MFKTKIINIYSMFAAGVMIIALYSCQKDDIPTNVTSEDNQVLSEKFRSYELTEVNNIDELYSIAASEPSNPVSLDFKIKSHPNWQFELSMDQMNKDIFDNTEFYNLDANDNETSVQLERIHGLSGKLNDAEHKSLFLFNKEYFEGEIIDGDKTYYMEQANKYDPSLADNMYVVYNEDDVIENAEDQCEQKGNADKMETGAVDEHSPLLASHTRKADVAYIGDYRLYLKYRNSSKAHSYMYYRMVYASKRYYDYNKVPIELRKRYGGLYTSSGGNQPRSYWNASQFLNEWRSYYNRSWFRNKNADVHYLFTGYNIQGNIVGMAWVGTVCRNRPYSFGYGQFLWTTTKANDLMAHEIGHIFGCTHVNGNNFMSPSLSTSSWRMASQTRNQLNYMLKNYGYCLTR